MFKFIDDWIHNKFAKKLHQDRDKHIKHAVDTYQEAHSETLQSNLIELTKRLEHEATRVYIIADKSILRARVVSARYVFIGALGLLGFSLMNGFLGFSSYNAYLLATAIIPPLVNWGINLYVIPEYYTQRIEAGMQTVIAGFSQEEALKNASSTHYVLTMCDQSTQVNLNEEVELVDSTRASRQPHLPVMQFASSEFSTFAGQGNEEKSYRFQNTVIDNINPPFGLKFLKPA